MELLFYTERSLVSPQAATTGHTALEGDTRLGGISIGTEVRRTTEGTEDITDVVARGDTSGESRVPLADDTLDDLDTSVVDVLNRGLISTSSSVEEVLTSRLARVRAVEVRGGTHDNDTGEINELGLSGTDHGLEGSVILLGRGAVVTGTVGEDLSSVGEGVTEDVTGVVDVAGGDIALDDGGGSSAGGIDAVGGVVLGAVGLGVVGVSEGGLAGESSSQLAQVVVDLEDLGAVDAAGVLPGVVGTLGEVAGGGVGGHFADVDLVLQGDLDGVASQGHTADGGQLGVDTGDTGDEEVGVGQVEGGVEDDGGDGDGGVDLGFTGDQLADVVVCGAVHIREQRRGSGDGNVVLEHVELGDTPPDGGFGFELGSLLGLDSI